LLAPYVGFEAVRHLVTGHKPEVSVLMVLTATRLVGMPFLGIAKQRLAETLGSSATRGEGAENLLCAYLAGAVFLGLAGNALLGWWWLDGDRCPAYCRRGGPRRPRAKRKRFVPPGYRTFVYVRSRVLTRNTGVSPSSVKVPV
jgi:hypothetical protein